MFDKLGLDHSVNLIDVALMQRNKDSLLVREILVHRADAHPGNLGNSVRRDGPEALALQDSYNCVKYRFNCLMCAQLLRSASARLFCDPQGDNLRTAKYEQMSRYLQYDNANQQH